MQDLEKHKYIYQPYPHGSMWYASRMVFKTINAKPINENKKLKDIVKIKIMKTGLYQIPMSVKEKEKLLSWLDETKLF